MTKKENRERMRLKRAALSQEELERERIKARERMKNNYGKNKKEEIKKKEKKESLVKKKKEEKRVKLNRHFQLMLPSRLLTAEEFLDKRFFFIDSEGYTEDNKSYLNLIAIYARFDNGEEYYRIKTDDFSTSSILRWIVRRVKEIQAGFAGHSVEGIIFGGMYDFTLWLKDLSFEQIDLLLHKKGEVLIDNHFYVMMIPRKMLIIREFGKRSIYICDVFGFTNTSFVSSIKSLGVKISKDELERLTVEKNNRGVFTKEITDEVIKYNKLELVYLSEMTENLKKELYNLGWYVKHFYGVGSVGNFLLAKHELHKQSHYLTEEGLTREQINSLEYALESSYYGGYIYPFAIGTYKGHVYHYDIKSAYPSVMVQLPAMEGGRWEYKEDISYEELRNISILSVVEIEYHQEKAYFPTRFKNGNVMYVKNGEGWYNVQMVLAAYEGLTGDEFIRIKRVWEFIPVSNEKPFSFVSEIYAEKNKTDKRVDPVRYFLLKVGMNNLYGKEIQVLGGDRDKVPAFYNVVYASAITAGTRAKLMRAINTIGVENVLLTMTDSIFCTKPLPASFLGSNLGDFGDESEDEGEITEFTCVQTGLYFYRTKDGELIFKHRGVYFHGEGNSIEEIERSKRRKELEMVTKILNWLKGEYKRKDLPLSSKKRFFAITGASNPTSYNKIGKWTDSEDLTDSMKKISYRDFFKSHGLIDIFSESVLINDDLSSDIRRLNPLSVKIDDFHRGIHETLWTGRGEYLNEIDQVKEMQEQIEYEMKQFDTYRNYEKDVIRKWIRENGGILLESLKKDYPEPELPTNLYSRNGRTLDDLTTEYNNLYGTDYTSDEIYEIIKREGSR